MIICGIKLTHDGAVSIIDNGVLKFSIEVEKLNNNKRYSEIKDVAVIPEILATYGYAMEDVDRFVIDGWHGSGTNFTGPSILEVLSNNVKILIEVAGYNENGAKDNILKRFEYGNKVLIAGKQYPYSSYMHVAGHVASTYCTSPFAQKNESSFILTWDGGQYPRLYYYDLEKNRIENLGHLFLFLGTMYSVFAQYFGPYKKTEAELAEDRKRMEIEGFFGGYSVAGKIMSYIAFGKVRPELLVLFEKVRKDNIEISNEFAHTYSKKLRLLIRPEAFTDEDVLASFHVYLEDLLVAKLKDKIQKYPAYKKNLCFSGGCALNIKWNSAIRNTGMFNDVYVPPFPNDSGSALGMACCEYLHYSEKKSVEWNVYSGPKLVTKATLDGWAKAACTVGQLAVHLHEVGEPVVFINGNAELGPRALGNRSILATPVSPLMKDILNDVKKREHYRPVAPICLEEFAPIIFDPGVKDPFMLFDHEVRTEWIKKIPAVCHLDGTARLQTISKEDNEVMFELLTSFKEASGIPLLCNTSANLNGSGFFPDVASAMQWGRLNYIWSENILYTKIEKVEL